MRWREFNTPIVERKEFTDNQQKAIPHGKSAGVEPPSEGPVNFYYKYRLGVKMAGSPDNAHPYESGGQYADDMVMIGYTDADNEIIDRATKGLGYKTRNSAKGKSSESPDTNTTSPVANWNKK